jgi:1-pyrroline-5-carboxylate dehydrogenase
VGNAADQKNSIGPVINQASKGKILEYIKKAVTEGGHVVAGGTITDGEGFFVQPTVIVGVTPKATIAQEEIFGPVLAVIKVKNFDEAITVANNTEFGLTGSLFSKNKKHLQRAEKEFFVGNLYLNRKCTGAMVGAHPFGGFNMSGTDSKAGGRDYLLLFLQAQSIAEKTNRA